jgi:hypothetical protein
VILQKHIPALLPIKGKQVKIIYSGIPAFCNNCWKIGHAHWECKETHKTNWLEFVGDLYINNDVTEEMLGSWVTSLYKYHPSLGGVPKNGTTAEFVGPHKDLRHLLTQKQAEAQSQPPSSPNTNTNDLRALLTNLRGQPSQRGQRGTQGQGRGCGQNTNTNKNKAKNNTQRGRGRGRGGNNQLIAGLVQLLNTNSNLNSNK